MTATPKGFRLHIGIFGRRNAGKSTLLNLVAGQDVSIVSPTPGTTTDPVEKPMEFIPMGPVLWIDTAGVDDVGSLGEKRLERSLRVIERTDLAIVVFHQEWGGFEQQLYDEFAKRGIPVIAVQNKIDLDADMSGSLPEGLTVIAMSAAAGHGLEELRQAILAAAPADFIESPPLVHDLLTPGDIAVLVVPIDKEAPKGRLILPQVQTIRDLLDGDCAFLVTREDRLAEMIANLHKKPALVVTDSQAFKEVAASVPADAGIPITGFSILYARAKGDLSVFAEGAAAIGNLKEGDRVLVAESCTHHSNEDDIGRVKLPNLMKKKTGKNLAFEFSSGHDFPANLGEYGLVLHCGACMTNRRAVLSRLMACRDAGVPIVNYGIAIAYCLGLLERALAPFPAALEAFRKSQNKELT